MKYQQFEDLPVWQAAIELGREVHALTDDTAFKGRYSLRDQIERAAVSASNNIAEGFERGTKQELLSFPYIARGSVGEVRSMLWLMDSKPVPGKCLRDSNPRDDNFFLAAPVRHAFGQLMR